MRLSVPTTVLTTMAAAQVAGDVLADMETGFDLCLVAVTSDDITAVEALPGRPLSIDGLAGARAALPADAAEIEVVTTEDDVVLCTVWPGDRQDPERRHRVFAWGVEKIERLAAPFDAVRVAPRPGLLGRDVYWCDANGGVLYVSVGNTEPAGDIRLALTNKVTPGAADPCSLEDSDA